MPIVFSVAFKMRLSAYLKLRDLSPYADSGYKRRQFVNSFLAERNHFSVLFEVSGFNLQL